MFRLMLILSALSYSSFSSAVYINEGNAYAVCASIVAGYNCDLKVNTNGSGQYDYYQSAYRYSDESGLKYIAYYINSDGLCGNGGEGGSNYQGSCFPDWDGSGDSPCSASEDMDWRAGTCTPGDQDDPENCFQAMEGVGITNVEYKCVDGTCTCSAGSGASDCSSSTPNDQDTDSMCIYKPDAGYCNEGSSGTINGVDICINSHPTNPATGPGSSSLVPSTDIVTFPSQTTTQSTTQPNNSGGGEQTVTETTTQQTQTTETIPLDGTSAPYFASRPNPEEWSPQDIDSGGGFDADLQDCGGGVFGGSWADCDTAVICNWSTEYVVAGVCIPKPTATKTTTETQEDVTTIIYNITDNSVIDSSTTTTTTTTNNSGQAESGEDEIPSSTAPSHSATINETYDDSMQGVYDRFKEAPIIAAVEGGFTHLIPTGSGDCPELSIDLSMTLIGKTVKSNIMCTSLETIRNPLEVLFKVMFLILAFRTFASA